MKKFIIFKASGGLTHMMIRLSQIIYLCKKMNRHLIIDTLKHGAFMNRFDKYFIINDNKLSYSSDYKIIPSKYKISNIENSTIKYKNGKYFLNDKLLETINKNINNDIKVLSSYMKAGSSINPNIKIKNNIFELIKKNEKINEKYIAIHFRNTDISNNSNKYISKIKECITKYKINIIYVASDDYNFFYKLEKDIKDIKNIKLIRYTFPEDKKGKNIHYSTKDKDKIIMNCLIDMYMLMNSSCFIPCMNSGLSRWIVNISNNQKNIFNIKTEKTIIYK